MNINLFLDDERYPPSLICTWREWIIVRSFDEAIAHMEKNGCPSFMSFDHDLGDGPSGHKVAWWMIERDMDMPGWIPLGFEFAVHNQNPIGARNIQETLSGYLKHGR